MGTEIKVKKKSKINIKKLIILILFILVIGLLVFGVLKSFKKDKPKEEKVVDKIKNIGYVVNDNDTKYFKDTFKELKELLTGKEIDEQKQAELIAKLFVIDFYSLGNKTSKNDVGGVQFVYTDVKSDFIDASRDTIYKLVKNNIDKKENDLPLVKEVTINSIEKINLKDAFDNASGKLDLEGKEGYKVSVTWTYNKDTKLQDSATLIIMPDGNKLSVGRLY